ncbi:MAG: phosphodiester glycosidase family protein [Chloracidobacterium sp.]|nr:phosphodiester glycosidase family protein [Chloracidobacterium sp.]
MNLLNLLFRECSTRYGFVKPWYLVSILCVLCALCGYSLAQAFKQVHPGVEYAQVEHKLGDDPVKINLLRLDLTRVRLDVHHALDKAIGLETTSSIATRKGAVAAINAGFFRLDKSEFAGDAAGALVIDGIIWSESKDDRVAMRINNGSSLTDVWFGHITVEAHLSYHFGNVPLSGINRQRGANEMVVYTPIFGERTMTDSLGTEVVFRNCNGGSHCGIVITENSGNSFIPKDGFVLSIGPVRSEDAEYLIERLKTKNDPFETKAKLGPNAIIRPQFQLTHMDDVTNGVPQLIRNERIDITWEYEKASKAFVFNRHPRTAVAKLKDGKFLMMTVDGRQPGVSVGMSLQELAEYLFSLGAVDAMNLDGGGSTTMFLDGKVVNKPSDPTGERKIGDAIVVTLRNKPAARK